MDGLQSTACVHAYPAVLREKRDEKYQPPGLNRLYCKAYKKPTRL